METGGSSIIRLIREERRRENMRGREEKGREGRSSKRKERDREREGKK